MQSMKRSMGHESSQEGEDGEEEGDDVELTQAIKRQRLEMALRQEVEERFATLLCTPEHVVPASST